MNTGQKRNFFYSSKCFYLYISWKIKYFLQDNLAKRKPRLSLKQIYYCSILSTNKALRRKTGPCDYTDTKAGYILEYSFYFRASRSRGGERKRCDSFVNSLFEEAKDAGVPNASPEDEVICVRMIQKCSSVSGAMHQGLCFISKLSVILMWFAFVISRLLDAYIWWSVFLCGLWAHPGSMHTWVPSWQPVCCRRHPEGDAASVSPSLLTL